jgi:hypothetical protein
VERLNESQFLKLQLQGKVVIVVSRGHGCFNILTLQLKDEGDRVSISAPVEVCHAGRAQGANGAMGEIVDDEDGKMDVRRWEFVKAKVKVK